MNDKHAGSKFQRVSPVERQDMEDRNEEKGGVFSCLLNCEEDSGR